MKKNRKTIFLVVICSLVSFLIGTEVGTPVLSEALLGGDIAKARKSRVAVAQKKLDTFRDQLLADTAKCNETVAMLTVMNSSVKYVNSLISDALTLGKKYPELQEAVKSLEGAQECAKNSLENSEKALLSLNNLLAGKEEQDVEPFDQAIKNASVSYLLTQQKAQAGKEFMEAATEILKAKKDSDQELAALHDLWACYYALDSYISGNKKDVEYWENYSAFLSNEGLAVCMQNAQLLSSLKPVVNLNLLADYADVTRNSASVKVKDLVSQNSFCGLNAVENGLQINTDAASTMLKNSGVEHVSLKSTGLYNIPLSSKDMLGFYFIFF